MGRESRSLERSMLRSRRCVLSYLTFSESCVLTSNLNSLPSTITTSPTSSLPGQLLRLISSLVPYSFSFPPLLLG